LDIALGGSVARSTAEDQPRRGHGEAEGGLEVDDKLELGGLLNRQISGLGTL